MKEGEPSWMRDEEVKKLEGWGTKSRGIRRGLMPGSLGTAKLPGGSTVRRKGSH